MARGGDLVVLVGEDNAQRHEPETVDDLLRNGMSARADRVAGDVHLAVAELDLPKPAGRAERVLHELHQHVLLPRAVDQYVRQLVVTGREAMVVVDAMEVLDGGGPAHDVRRRDRPLVERTELCADLHVFETNGVHRASARSASGG